MGSFCHRKPLGGVGMAEKVDWLKQRVPTSCKEETRNTSTSVRCAMTAWASSLTCSCHTDASAPRLLPQSIAPCTPAAESVASKACALAVLLYMGCWRAVWGHWQLRGDRHLVQGAPARFGELAQRTNVSLRLGALRCKGGREGVAVLLEVLQHARQAALQSPHLPALLCKPPRLACEAEHQAWGYDVARYGG